MTEKIENKRLIGKIIVLNKRGYGFISCKDIPFTRIYFHWTNLLQQTINFQELKKGDEVEFEPIKKEDGTYKAIKIDVFEKEVKIDLEPAKENE